MYVPIAMQNVPIVEYSKMVFVHSSNSSLELDYGTQDVLRACLYERCIVYSPVYEY